MQHNTIIKTLLFRCIPLNVNMKRYYLSKYRFIVKHNGSDFATEKFKAISQYLMSLRSSSPQPCPVRRNGWMKRLEVNFKSHPHWVLSFLKIFPSMGVRKSIEEVSNRFSSLLSSLEDEVVPRFIMIYVRHLSMTKDELVLSYSLNRSNKRNPYHRYCIHHDLRTWLSYWSKIHYEWTGLREFGESVTAFSSGSYTSDYQVLPDTYRSKGISQQEAYEVDFYYFIKFLAFNTQLDHLERDFLREFLSPDGKYHLLAMKSYDLSTLPTPKILNGAPFGTHYGEIHFVDKAGGDLRPIAVPNRFIQEALYPVHKHLVSVVRRKGGYDASFAQCKFNNYIQSRVNTDDRFIGSIDLKNATERLPLSWFLPLEEIIGIGKDPGWTLFKKACRGTWNLNGKPVSWKRGQPLGTLPSFQVLALTHHLILEALSLEEGYGHRPYRILGDDLIVASKKLYHRYISECNKRRILISKGKTFSGSIAQFAGQTFIKNAVPFYTPDPTPLYKTNLFDWSYSTGIKLRWRGLPSRIRKIFDNNHLLFDTVQTLLVYPRGTSRGNWSDKESSMLVSFFSRETPDSAPDIDKYRGWVNHRGQLTILSNPEKKRDGLFTRYRKTNMPEWLEKFRPTQVDTALTFARDWLGIL